MRYQRALHSQVPRSGRFELLIHLAGHLLRLFETQEFELDLVLNRETFKDTLSKNERAILVQTILDIFRLTLAEKFLGELVEHDLQSQLARHSTLVH